MPFPFKISPKPLETHCRPEQSQAENSITSTEHSCYWWWCRPVVVRIQVDYLWWIITFSWNKTTFRCRGWRSISAQGNIEKGPHSKALFWSASLYSFLLEISGNIVKSSRLFWLRTRCNDRFFRQKVISASIPSLMFADSINGCASIIDLLEASTRGTAVAQMRIARRLRIHVHRFKQDWLLPKIRLLTYLWRETEQKIHACGYMIRSSSP